MLDTNFSILGFNRETFAKMEARIKDKSQFTCEEEYLEAVQDYQAAKKNDAIAFLSFPNLNRCIFNIKVFSQKKFDKYIACTDFSSTLLLLQLDDKAALKVVAQTQLHTDLIQGLLIHDNSIYTCSADKNICRVQVKLNLHPEEESGYSGIPRRPPAKSQSTLLQ